MCVKLNFFFAHSFFPSYKITAKKFTGKWSVKMMPKVLVQIIFEHKVVIILLEIIFAHQTKELKVIVVIKIDEESTRFK